MAKKKAEPKACSECGGPGRGRHAHKPTCSKYKQSVTGKRRGEKKSASMRFGIGK